MYLPTPLEDGPVDCAECHARLEEESYFDGDDSHYCEGCFLRFAEEAKLEAESSVETDFRITRPLPPYDPTVVCKPTPDEYAAGSREAITPNAHLTHCRHCHTNYEELIAGLGRSNAFDRIRYGVIRARVDELLREAIDGADFAEETGDEGDA